MRWSIGSATIDNMLARNELQRVPANREHADNLINQARRHLISAGEVCEHDPEGGYALVYDAARKALTAILENQGLRPTTRGGHIAVGQAVHAQLDRSLGEALQPFDRMRRQRHDVEYPPVDGPRLTPEDVREDLAKTAIIVERGALVLDQMSPFSGAMG